MKYKNLPRICKHQLYCANNHDYIPCSQEGCIWGFCDTCNVYYNPLFDCSKLLDEELPEVLKNER